MRIFTDNKEQTINTQTKSILVEIPSNIDEAIHWFKTILNNSPNNVSADKESIAILRKIIKKYESGNTLIKLSYSDITKLDCIFDHWAKDIMPYWEHTKEQFSDTETPVLSNDLENIRIELNNIDIDPNDFIDISQDISFNTDTLEDEIISILDEYSFIDNFQDKDLDIPSSEYLDPSVQTYRNNLINKLKVLEDKAESQRMLYTKDTLQTLIENISDIFSISKYKTNKNIFTETNEY